MAILNFKIILRNHVNINEDLIQRFGTILEVMNNEPNFTYNKFTYSVKSHV